MFFYNIFVSSVITSNMKLILSVFLLISLACVLGQDLPDDPMDPVRGPNENCLRCLCHARTGCYFMKNCADYSISKDYWNRAGRPTVLDDDPNSDISYTNCKKDDGCVMRAIRGYLTSMPDRDCNCDGRIDCKDYAAIHYKGNQCKSSFDPTYLTRLDRCLKNRGFTITEGWRMNC